jgi:hypothetical protein
MAFVLHLYKPPSFGLKVVDPRPALDALDARGRRAAAMTCVTALAAAHPDIFNRILVRMGDSIVPRPGRMREILHAAGPDLADLADAIPHGDEALALCLTLQRNADLIKARLGLASGIAGKRGRGEAGAGAGTKRGRPLAEAEVPSMAMEEDDD